jgi:hypothetical protein
MNDLTITDVLSGREELSAQFTITSDQRLYYNYHLHDPSREVEMAARGHDPRERDFRSMREKELKRLVDGDG